MTDDPDRTLELLWRPGTGESRPGLSLDRIVPAAVAVADAEGLAGLSMRKVAEALGYTTMALYRHVPGRDELLELMRDAVCAAEPTAPDGDWRSRLEAWARDAWRIRRRHPWLADIRGSRHVPGPNGIAAYERLLAAAGASGLGPREVIAVAELLGRFVDAEAARLAQVARTERDSGIGEDAWWSARESLYGRLGDYPVITALWEAGGWDDPADTFEFGLARILDGIELLLENRDVKRDEISPCEACGLPVEQAALGRRRAYCSRACQQRAYRRRRSGRAN